MRFLSTASTCVDVARTARCLGNCDFELLLITASAMISLFYDRPMPLIGQYVLHSWALVVLVIVCVAEVELQGAFEL